MVRRFTMAMAVLGAFLVAAAGSSQAGWGGHSESSQPGETMSTESEAPMNPESETSMSPESEPTEGTTGAYEDPGEGGTQSSGYDREVAVGTGRLSEEGERESGDPAVSEFGGTPFRHGIDDGP